MRSQYVQTRDIRLHVMTDGPEDGTSVVLLHGFPEFHYGWRKQVPALAAAGFHVIVPDQRGYNLSDKPRGVSAYGVDRLVGDLLGLLDHFGIEQARLAGHDWGAMVAWQAALSHPQRVGRLAILNVPHPDVILRFILGNPRQRRRSWYIFFFQLPGLAEWTLGRRNFETLARVLARSGRRGTFTPQDLHEYRKAWGQPGALTGMLNWYRAAVRAGLRHAFERGRLAPRRVQTPTLVLWGRHDPALGLDMLQPSIDLCDNGRSVLFERATHWVQHDEPEGVNRQLIEFLR
jgi:pimeloyl-ACP methyl ester carboxylesterase